MCISIGIIPNVKLGSLGYFNIGDSLVTFASKSSGGVEIRAFTGLSADVLYMLNDILNSEGALYQDSYGISQQLAKYVYRNTSTVGVDTNRILFNFRKNNDPSSTKNNVNKPLSERDRGGDVNTSLLSDLPKYSAVYAEVLGITTCMCSNI